MRGRGERSREGNVKRGRVTPIAMKKGGGAGGGEEVLVIEAVGTLGGAREEGDRVSKTVGSSTGQAAYSPGNVSDSQGTTHTSFHLHLRVSLPNAHHPLRNCQGGAKKDGE